MFTKSDYVTRSPDSLDSSPPDPRLAIADLHVRFEDVGPFVRASTANPRKPAAVAPTLLSVQPVLSSVVCVEDAGPASR